MTCPINNVPLKPFKHLNNSVINIIVFQAEKVLIISIVFYPEFRKLQLKISICQREHENISSYILDTAFKDRCDFVKGESLEIRSTVFLTFFVECNKHLQMAEIS